MNADLSLRTLGLAKLIVFWPLPDVSAPAVSVKPPYTSYELQKWSKAVKERDGYRCAVRRCRSVEDLHAHHILKKSLYPELALELKNGVTLCGTCHCDIHALEFLRDQLLALLQK